MKRFYIYLIDLINASFTVKKLMLHLMSLTMLEIKEDVKFTT